MTVSVTPDGAIGPGLVTSIPVLPAGHSSANAALAPKRPAAATRIAAVLLNLLVRVMWSLRLVACCRRGARQRRQDRGDGPRTEIPLVSGPYSRQLWASSLSLQAVAPIWSIDER